jgi:hypothetical protein
MKYEKYSPITKFNTCILFSEFPQFPELHSMMSKMCLGKIKVAAGKDAPS